MRSLPMGGREILMGVAILVSVGIAQEKQWLEYHCADDVRVPWIGSNPVIAEVDSNAPAGVRLPAFEGDRQFFGRWLTPMVSVGYRWIALDRVGDSERCNRLYIDSDGDGHLDDETAVISHHEDPKLVWFGPVEVVLALGDKSVVYHLNFRFFCRGDTQILWVVAGGWYEGTVTVGREKMVCKLFDRNTNGTFNDQGGYFFSDCIEFTGQGDPIVRLVGRYIEVNGQWHYLDVAREGSYIALTKAEDLEFGVVRVPQAMTELLISNENGVFPLTPKAGACSVPAGEYGIDGWAIERTDKTGRLWRAQCRGVPKRLCLDIVQDTEAEPDVGEPLVATLEISHEDGQTHSLRHTLQGRNGERIILICDGVQAPAPTLNIKNEDGTYEGQCNFAYG